MIVLEMKETKNEQVDLLVFGYGYGTKQKGRIGGQAINALTT